MYCRNLKKIGFYISAKLPTLAGDLTKVKNKNLKATLMTFKIKTVVTIPEIFPLTLIKPASVRFQDLSEAYLNSKKKQNYLFI